MCLSGAIRARYVPLQRILRAHSHPLFFVVFFGCCLGIYALMPKTARWRCGLVSWESGVKVSRGERRPGSEGVSLWSRGDLSWSDSSALLWTWFKPARHLQYPTLVMCVCVCARGSSWHTKCVYYLMCQLKSRGNVISSWITYTNIHFISLIRCNISFIHLSFTHIYETTRCTIHLL